MAEKTNQAVWFEIPVKDMSRAKEFYNQVFGYKIFDLPAGEIQMAVFDGSMDGIGACGALVFNEEYYKPSENGVLIYLKSPTGDLQNELDKAEQFGGKVVHLKSLIDKEVGFMGIIIDSEGNRIGLFSRE